MQSSFEILILMHFTEDVSVNTFDTFESVTMKQNGDDLTHRGLLGNEQTLVLGFGHQDGIVDSNQATASHL